METAALVATLKAASDAYYNGKPLLMDDAAFDAMQERLRELDPENPYLSEIGAPPDGVAATLPYPMPSLDKIKPGQDLRFLAGSGFVLSEKLDGLSALWIPAANRLYLRGNGIKGQDISHLVPLGIQGLARSLSVARGFAVVRGELVVSRATVTTLARSWVNGIVHRDAPAAAEVAKIRFVAYEVMRPTGLTRSQQFAWLVENGYEVPWWVAEETTGVDALKAHLLARREHGAYDTDGIVVALDRVPTTPVPGKNPKDAVAFKMPLLDQSATTKVRAVLWAPSAQGYLIPKLEFDPVVVGGATIQFCTAHTARHVVQNRLGPGATVVIRRSGDVIPTIDRVISGVEPQLPEGTWEWVDDVHIRATGPSPALDTAKLHHFIKTLKVAGAGPATAASLVSAGLVGPAAVLKATPAKLSELLGPKSGQTFHAGLQKAVAAANEIDFMISSSRMPRGVGETKLKAIFAVEPDITKWRPDLSPKSWTTESFAAFMAELPKYVVWRRAELATVPFPLPLTPQLNPESLSRGPICFSGFRDKALEERATSIGFTVSTLTSKTVALIVPDNVSETVKVRAAREKGIRVLTKSQFMTQYLGTM